MTDDGIAFDGRTPETGPLGGAEAQFLTVAEVLAARGHRVMVRNRCAGPLIHKGVDWAPLDRGVPETCDLAIANRGHRLIGLVPKAKRRVFWLHNPGTYLKKFRYVRELWRYRPIIVTSGHYHALTVPWWMPSGGRVVIPYAIPDDFRHAEPRADVPPPRAIFASNPLRGLDWLLDVWEQRIRPAMPKAELHLYCGPSVYGSAGAAKGDAMREVLARAIALSDKGVRRFDPVARPELIAALGGSRAMLYRGDPGETFCLAVAEAQALGLPAVVQPLGSMSERVQDGVTGFVAPDEETFARHAIALLGDDVLWRRQHQAALRFGRGLDGDDVARQFEALAS